MGMKGLVWSASAMGVLLNEGIGDTIRVSLTPRPGGDRRDEVYAACELLQALGLRAFSPSVTACPGCGRTTSSTFQELAERTQDYIREQMPEWKKTLRRRREPHPRGDGLRRQRPGRVEGGQHRHQPARAPARRRNCPVYIDGEHFTTLRGTYDELAEGFRSLVDNYVATRYRAPPKPTLLPYIPEPAGGTAAPGRRLRRRAACGGLAERRARRACARTLASDAVHVGVDDRRGGCTTCGRPRACCRARRPRHRWPSARSSSPAAMVSAVVKPAQRACTRARCRPRAEILGGERFARDRLQVGVDVGGRDVA